jgi:hypothetical protein
MELPLAALSGFQPKTGTLEQWNAAYVRVEDYLRAHRIHSRLHQSRLIERVLERAARRHADDPTQDPITLAADETEALMLDWFALQLGELPLAPDRLAAQARTAMLLADVPAKWPYAFLETENTPPAVHTAMEKGSLQAGPDLAVSSMVPRDIDLGTLPAVAGETLEKLERWPLVRLIAMWTAFAGILMALFALTR